ncbi:MAG: 50S ribosomal protein L18 [Candidatus Marsarchaeota archaeon]|jgi:large subunit ribosomal protein L18|nr:50S ribosomal protein L18 [Candidatus Marsarchaeota archaeon]MCL5112072.1 50S ribosomal protein L18 [Candidatus Marsarchaeota archaeon]
MYRHIRARRRSAHTNYKRRISLLAGGLTRIVVRKSNRGVIVQAVAYTPKGDSIIASAQSRELKKMGWPARANVPTAYLTGLLLAKKGRDSVKGGAVLDIGLYKPVKSSVVFAGAKGAADGGIKLINSIEIDQRRLSGSHISDYARSGKAAATQFSKYAKENVDAANIAALFESVKKKILSD